MKTCGITVCVDYADFLEVTLEANAGFFDEIIVVTVERDARTIDLAKQYGLRVVLTDRLYENGDPFNKGRAINDGLRHVRKSPGRNIVHFDADIVLPRPHKTLKMKLEAMLDTRPNKTQTMVGMNRRMCNSRDAWESHKLDNDLSQFELETRTQGNPIPGFFQMWNSMSPHTYPEDNATASTSDLEFSKKFGARLYLEEPATIHLASLPYERWTNWNGRTSPSFEKGPR